MHTSSSENRINALICTVSHDTYDRIMVCYLIKESSFAYSFMVNPIYLYFAYNFLHQYIRFVHTAINFNVERGMQHWVSCYAYAVNSHASTDEKWIGGISLSRQSPSMLFCLRLEIFFQHILFHQIIIKLLFLETFTSKGCTCLNLQIMTITIDKPTSFLLCALYFSKCQETGNAAFFHRRTVHFFLRIVRELCDSTGGHRYLCLRLESSALSSMESASILGPR